MAATMRGSVGARRAVGGRAVRQAKRSSVARATRATSAVTVMAAGAGFKVAVLGAAGGIGQPLSMLLKMNPLVSELALYDIANTPGVAADLSHCNTPAQVTAHVGPDDLAACLKGCDLVVIPAGVPRKPGMTRDDLFNINAGIVKSLCEAVGEHCNPNGTYVNIISNPVNSTVPIGVEALTAAGWTSAAERVIGVTTLDIVRSNTFVAQKFGYDTAEVNVPVIGGHAGITILPLLSQATPPVELLDADREEMTVRIQNAGTEVVEAKAGAGSATLSMAYAAARMAESCLRGLIGEPDVVECAYVKTDVEPGLDYFATPVKITKKGVEAQPYGSITEYEAGWLEKLKPELEGSIAKGIAFSKGGE